MLYFAFALLSCVGSCWLYHYYREENRVLVQLYDGVVMTQAELLKVFKQNGIEQVRMNSLMLSSRSAQASY